ncbi:MAG: hypothetical protein JJU36_04000 [Phycisphaeraceae bacterium]|nr:hypothetical protein [Phycisphaeraceae bacterium]
MRSESRQRSVRRGWVRPSLVAVMACVGLLLPMMVGCGTSRTVHVSSHPPDHPALQLLSEFEQDLGHPPVGGANSPPPSEPLPFVIDLAEIDAGGFQIQVPTGRYQAPPGGAPNYRVPGPIAAFRGPDGVWRGRGYLETYPRLQAFSGSHERRGTETIVTLDYRFEDDRRYQVEMVVGGGMVRMSEQAQLGPRNLFVMDFYYRWQPSVAFAINRTAEHHAFLYLPCYYDKPEVTIRPPLLIPNDLVDEDEGILPPDRQPSGVAILSRDSEQRDIAGFWMRQVDQWEGRDSMGMQLWQRRQLPGEPASRHFVGPETKSDSTPNPRTAAMLGPSLYEGHVTAEFSLGTGTRQMAFTVVAKPEEHDQMPEPFKQRAAAHR